MEKNSGGGGHRASRGKMTFVNCGQPSCEGKSAILLQNLKRHTEKVHGVGVAPLVKGEQQLGGFLAGVKRTNDDELGGREKRGRLEAEGGSDVFADLDLNENLEPGEVEQELEQGLDVKTFLARVEDTIVATVKETEKRLVATVKETVESTIESGVKDKKVEEDAAVVQAKVKTIKDLMAEMRSVRQITEKFPEFEHKAEKENAEVHCIVCNTDFSYPSSEPSEFSAAEKLSRKFRNLKTSLVRHLACGQHCENIKEEEAKSRVWAKEEKRNRAVGITLGRMVYHLVKKGRPDTDFTDQVYLAVRGGADCGDINHSWILVTKLLPFLANEVRRRLKLMFGARLVATGCLPPVNILADKATHQRWSRQFVGGITVNPGATININFNRWVYLHV